MHKKIGLFFGTFNPIHVGHLIIANYIKQEQKFDELWFVITPHNPFKTKTDLLPDHHRLAMVQEAIDKSFDFKASDIEFKLSQPNYTVDTLAYLTEKHPDLEFSLIMGEDNLRSFHKWKNYEVIAQQHKIIVYPRHIQPAENADNLIQKLEEYPILKKFPSVFVLSKAPVIDISSSLIRNMIKEKQSVKFLLTDEVLEYVDKMNFYK